MALILTLVAGCGSEKEQEQAETKQPDKIVIQAPAAPPTAPLLQMLANEPFDDEVEIELLLYKSVEEATSRIVKNEADFTVLPVNVASKLYNKDIDISLANVNTWGILYLLSTDSSINEWTDLVNTELYVGAQGASPDIITRYLLAANKVSEDELSLNYMNSPEIAQMMIQGLIDHAVLPEPLVTNVLNNAESVEIIFDYNQQWQLAEGENTRLPQTGIVVQNSFAENYPDALNTIQNAYQQALEQTVDNPSLVAPLVEEHFGIPGPVFEQSMTRINLAYADGQQAKEDVENYLSKLLEFSPEMVGGKLPDEKFYLAK
ncbi:ABC transporter substrate-binding protein [Desulfofalx alkaliphila]|uniref:ABC transporter substrate-binding protein n=1 Tax=Desulfofalx alkaliphila TaxID=105483 RepID=UPI00146FAA60|nr:ABC transporter substrate-binding protein [Desulfofalx alkaliphila]